MRTAEAGNGKEEPCTTCFETRDSISINGPVMANWEIPRLSELLVSSSVKPQAWTQSFLSALPALTCHHSVLHWGNRGLESNAQY